MHFNPADAASLLTNQRCTHNAVKLLCFIYKRKKKYGSAIPSHRTNSGEESYIMQ